MDHRACFNRSLLRRGELLYIVWLMVFLGTQKHFAHASRCASNNGLQAQWPCPWGPAIGCGPRVVLARIGTLFVPKDVWLIGLASMGIHLFEVVMPAAGHDIYQNMERRSRTYRPSPSAYGLQAHAFLPVTLGLRPAGLPSLVCNPALLGPWG